LVLTILKHATKAEEKLNYILIQNKPQKDYHIWHFNTIKLKICKYGQYNEKLETTFSCWCPLPTLSRLLNHAFVLSPWILRNRTHHSI